VEKATKEMPSSGTETEATPAANDETPPVVETTAAVEDKNETSEAQDVADKSEAEETNPAAEETSETAEEEEAEEKPEIKVGVVKICDGILVYNFIFNF
jgi:cytochrome c oxidase subunit 6b